MIIAPLAGPEATDTPSAVCGADPGFFCEWVLDVTNSEAMARFGDWFVAKPLKIVLIFVVASILSRLVRRSIRRLVDRIVTATAVDSDGNPTPPGRFAGLRARAVEKSQSRAAHNERRRQRAQALGMVLKSVASMAIYGMALLIAVAEFGVSLGPLVAGAGIIGVALGFGAQSLVRDFLSGIFMLVEDQYGVGDFVDVGEASGVVEEVTLRTTRLRDIEGTVWFVPNGEIRRVGNKSQQWARAVLDIEVAYDTDLDRAMEVMKVVADEVWQAGLEHAPVLEEPEVVGVHALGESAIHLRVMLKVEPGTQWSTAREMRKRIKVAFDEAHIEFPFPQLTVWLRNEGGPGPDPDTLKDPNG